MGFRKQSSSKTHRRPSLGIEPLEARRLLAASLEAEPNDSYDNANPISVEESTLIPGLLRGVIAGHLDAGETDYFEFAAEVGDQLSISVTGDTVESQAHLGFLFKDPFGIERGARELPVQVTSDDSSFIRAYGRSALAEEASYSASVLIGRDLTLQSDANGGNDSLADADSVSFSNEGGLRNASIVGTIRNTVEETTDQDFVFLGYLNAGNTVSLATRLPEWSRLEPFVQWVNADGESLVDSDLADSTAQGIVLEDGAVYAKVTALSGEGWDAQYVLDIAIGDLVDPLVRSFDALPPPYAPGSPYAEFSTGFRIGFSEDLLEHTLRSDAFELHAVGQDGIDNTPDDLVYRLDAQQDDRRANVTLAPTEGPLPNGEYRLTLAPLITDRSGNPLAGETGYSMTFTVSGISTDVVLEGIGNSSVDQATPLTFQEDPNGTGWQRSEPGYGSIGHAEDWWSFEAQKGDAVSAWLQFHATTSSRPYLYRINDDETLSSASQIQHFSVVPDRRYLDNFVIPEDGTYAIKILSGPKVSVGYDLRVYLNRGTQTESSGYRNVDELSYAIEGNTRSASVAGTLHQGADRDTFALGVLNAGNSLTVDASSLPSWSILEPMLEVYDGDWNVVVDDDPSDASLSAVLDSDGEYFARVRSKTTVINGSRFFLTEHATRWQDAEAAAVAAGGHLASIDNRQQSQWLASQFLSDNRWDRDSPFSNWKHEAWIGLSGVTGYSIWSDGTPVDLFQAIQHSTNNEAGTDEDHGVVLVGERGRWCPSDSLHRGIIEVPAESDAPILSGASSNSQYVLNVIVNDDVLPTVRSIDGLPNEGDSVDSSVLHTFDVQFSEPVTLSSEDELQVDLRAAGTDGIFDTADDAVYDLSGEFDSDHLRLKLLVTAGSLVTGPHRFSLSGDLQDDVGNMLDGNGDSLGGGDLVRQFTLTSVPMGALLEGRDNDSIRNAVPLAIEADTNGTQWLRSQVGYGVIDSDDDRDWWSFEASAGDFVDVWVQTSDRYSPPNIAISSQGLNPVSYEKRTRTPTSALSEFTILEDGVYAVRVSGSSLVVGSYDIRVNLSRNPLSEHPYNQSQRFGSPVVFEVNGTTLSSTLAGTIARAERSSYKLIDLEQDRFSLGWQNAGTVLRIDASSLPAWSTLEPLVEVIDSAQNVLADDDPTDAVASMVLDADGEYFVRVRTATAVFDGSRFFLTDPGLNWTEAEAAAVAAGGHLASIDSHHQNQWLNDTLGAGWIGLRKVAPDGNFSWSDGSSANYRNWHPGDRWNSGESGSDLDKGNFARMVKGGYWQAVNNKPWFRIPGIVEIPAKADDPVLSGAGVMSQYVLNITMIDDAPLVVKSVQGIPAENGTTDKVIQGFHVFLSEIVDPTSGTFDLRAAGVDGLFDTDDDVIYSTNPTHREYRSTLTVAITGGLMEPGRYRFTAHGDLMDLAGHALDGDRDAVVGGDSVHHFSISSIPDGWVHEGASNENAELATPLAFELNPDGTLWLRSEIGFGAIGSDDDQDWWSFNALAGDSIDVRVQRIGRSTKLAIYHDGKWLSDLSSHQDSEQLDIVEDGVYTIRVTSSSGASAYNVRVSLYRGEHTENEDNDSRKSANVLTFSQQGTEKSATIGGTTDGSKNSDFYSLGFLNAGVTVTLDASLAPAWSTAEPIVQLVDDHGSKVADSDSTDSRVHVVIESDGEYFVEVSDGKRFDRNPFFLSDLGNRVLRKYVLEVGISDAVAPSVRRTDGLPNENGTTSELFHAFSVTFSEAIDPNTLDDTAVQLKAAGADGVFDTSDDVAYVLASEFDAASFRWDFVVVGSLTSRAYRFTLTDDLTDLAGNALDGDGDSAAGGDFVRRFTVLSLPNRAVMEGLDNDSKETATPLALEADSAGTDWSRSEVGYGAIDSSSDEDWWSFEASAGDKVEIWVQPRGSNERTASVGLYNAHHARSYIAGHRAEQINEPISITGVEIAEDGVYFVRLASVEGLVSYGVRVNVFRGGDLEEGGIDFPNFSQQRAVKSAVIAGTIDGNDDDRFSLGLLNPGTTVVLDASALPGWSDLKPLVEVVDFDGNLVPDEDPRDALVTAVVETDGHYYARIRHQEATNGSDARSGVESQYVLGISVIDLVPPVIRSMDGLPQAGESTQQLLHEIRVKLSEELDPTSQSDLAIELRAAGNDGVYGTDDDGSYDIVSRYLPSSLEYLVHVVAGPLTTGPHRFSISGNFSDLAGNRFDGESDGITGGDFVHDFTVSSVPDRVVLEGIDNESYVTATPLALEADSAGTGWLRSEVGYGVLEFPNDQDWWSFEGLAGDSLDLWGESNEQSIVVGLFREEPGTDPTARNLSQVPTSSQRGITLSEDGVYYIRVGPRHAIDAYNIHVRLNRSAPIELPHSGTNSVDYSRQGTFMSAVVSGTIFSGYDRFERNGADDDTYSLGFLNAGTQVSLDASSLPNWSTLEPVVEVVDRVESGNVITDSDLSDAVASVLIEEDGYYYARVRTETAVIDGSRFFLTEPGLTWTEAEASAVAAGGHLASIENDRQNRWLSRSLGRERWIGLNNVDGFDLDRTYSWSDGSSLEYTNWGFGQPGVGWFVSFGSRWSMPGDWNTESEQDTTTRRGIVEVPAGLDAPILSGSGIEAQYQLDIQLNDLVPPVIRSLNGLPQAGQAIDDLIHPMNLELSEELDLINSDALGIELRAAGDDGIFESNDDEVYSIVTQKKVVSDNDRRFTRLEFVVVSGALTQGLHRLTVSGDFTDLAGNHLDGDGDGTADGDFVHEFIASTIPDRVVLEGLRNNTTETAIPLAFESDSLGTGWFRSEVGHGAIDSADDEDWWSFEGVAGDWVDIFPIAEHLPLNVNLYHDGNLLESGTGNQRSPAIGGFELPRDGVYFVSLASASTHSSFSGYDFHVKLNRNIPIEPTSPSVVLDYEQEGTTKMAFTAGTIASSESNVYSIGFLYAGATVTLDASSLPSWSTLEPLVEVIDGPYTGNMIADDDPSDALASVVIEADGYYYARIRAETAVLSEVGPDSQYELHVVVSNLILPTIVEIDDIGPYFRQKAPDPLSLRFATKMDGSTISPSMLSLYRDDVLVELPESLFISTNYDDLRFAVHGLQEAALQEGEYRIQFDMTQIRDAYGVTGTEVLAFDTVTWTIDLTAPSLRIDVNLIDPATNRYSLSIEPDETGSPIVEAYVYAASESQPLHRIGEFSTTVTRIEFAGLPGADYRFFTVGVDEAGNLQMLRLADTGDDTVLIDSAYRAEFPGRIIIAEGADTRLVGHWIVDEPEVIDGVFVHQLLVRNRGTQRIQLQTANPWRNPILAQDVNHDGQVSALDALQIINRLTSNESQRVFPELVGGADHRYLDVSGDRALSALDALQVINRMGEERRAISEAEQSPSEFPLPSTVTTNSNGFPNDQRYHQTISSDAIGPVKPKVGSGPTIENDSSRYQRVDRIFAEETSFDATSDDKDRFALGWSKAVRSTGLSRLRF